VPERRFWSVVGVIVPAPVEDVGNRKLAPEATSASALSRSFDRINRAASGLPESGNVADPGVCDRSNDPELDTVATIAGRLPGLVEHQGKGEVRQAELFGGGVVGTKDSTEQGVQIGADRGDGVEASLCGRCPHLSNVEERADQVQHSFEEQHARSGVVGGCQAGRRPKSVFRSDPQIVRAGGVERWFASATMAAT
jgi:hypothetical protein